MFPNSKELDSENTQGFNPEEVGHGLKGIMVGRINESRKLFYRGHEINMAGF